MIEWYDHFATFEEKEANAVPRAELNRNRKLLWARKTLAVAVQVLHQRCCFFDVGGMLSLKKKSKGLHTGPLSAPEDLQQEISSAP